MVDTLTTIAQFAAYVIAGAIVALTAIAPLTKTDWDNKFLVALVWIHDNVLAKVLPAHTVIANASVTPGPTTPPSAS